VFVPDKFASPLAVAAVIVVFAIRFACLIHHRSAIFPFTLFKQLNKVRTKFVEYFALDQ